MARLVPTTAAGLLCLLLAGILVAQPAFPQPLPKVSAEAKTVAKDNNVFALNLYSQLGNADRNMIASPYSISTALAMTYAGARGKTADQMAQTLHFGLEPDRFHSAFGELVSNLNAKGTKRPYELSVANALWGQKGVGFLPAFVQLAEYKYGAGLKELDFANNTEEARQTINGWVEKQTNDKIKELLKKDVLKPDTRLVLTNAIYFKSAWANPFAEKLTQLEDFTIAAGKKVQAPMMHKTETMPYFKGDGFALVKIPYQGNALSMIVLLPKSADGLSAVEKSLTSTELAGWLAKMKLHRVDLKLPKFKITSEFRLEELLSKMGMPLAFTPAADFSGMTTQEKLFIGAVIHKAFVDVHEKGTEAAAATAVIMAKGGPPSGPEATFYVDHPFTYLIYENNTGSILFMGRVNNPKG
jgi:serpin B